MAKLLESVSVPSWGNCPSTKARTTTDVRNSSSSSSLSSSNSGVSHPIVSSYADNPLAEGLSSTTSQPYIMDRLPDYWNTRDQASTTKKDVMVVCSNVGPMLPRNIAVVTSRNVRLISRTASKEGKQSNATTAMSSGGTSTTNNGHSNKDHNKNNHNKTSDQLKGNKSQQSIPPFSVFGTTDLNPKENDDENGNNSEQVHPSQVSSSLKATSTLQSSSSSSCSPSSSSCCSFCCFCSCCCPETTTVSDKTWKLLFCFVGLQISYLSWAYLQEYIMTTRFDATMNNPTGRFPSAIFCVFCNRTVALIVACTVVKWRHGRLWNNTQTAPLGAYFPCAISNTLSSISQYSSLQYVSFPVVTVFKSSTIIPVMIMGYCLKGSTYPWSRYVEAVLITLGVAIFSLYSSYHDDSDDNIFPSQDVITTTTTTMTDAEMDPTLQETLYSTTTTGEASWPVGPMLLVGYVMFDSFTTQWQDRIYTKYGRDNVDSFQMMLGVDSTAILFTTISLYMSGEIPLVLEFFYQNPHVIVHTILCPITSTCGQLFIFFTIKKFGPVVFTIIMTTRKLFSICISAVVFGHSIDIRAAMGGLLVLLAVGNSVRRSWNERMGLTKRSREEDDDIFGIDEEKQQQQQQQQQQMNTHCDLTYSSISSCAPKSNILTDTVP